MMPNSALLGGSSYNCQPKINAQPKEKAEKVEGNVKYRLNNKNTEHFGKISKVIIMRAHQQIDV